MVNTWPDQVIEYRHTATGPSLTTGCPTIAWCASLPVTIVTCTCKQWHSSLTAAVRLFSNLGRMMGYAFLGMLPLWDICHFYLSWDPDSIAGYVFHVMYIMPRYVYFCGVHCSWLCFLWDVHSSRSLACFRCNVVHFWVCFQGDL